MKKYSANIITSCRILLSVIMLFFPVHSYQFYITYLLCGISDMIDGAVARKINSDNEFGAKLDTVADFAFITAAFIRWLTVIFIPRWIFVWIVIIALVKGINILLGFIRSKKLICPHTVLNKITGFTLFVLPLTLHIPKVKYSFFVACAIASVSAIYEFVVINKNSDRKRR